MAELRMRTLWRAGVLLAVGLSLTSCDAIREAAGVTKQPPDEFAIATKAPLIIPPDYNLKPPKPGAAPLNQVSPTQAAQAALYGADTQQIAASIQGNYSEAEKLLLAQSGAAAADDSIRRVIAADNAKAEDTGSFTDSLLFGSSATASGDAPLDANAEEARIDAAKNGDKPAGEQKEKATIGDSSENNSNSSWWPF
ncbi:MAG: DUF3035 domain-containing protein [Proteobacteria bacterium]|nr:DUF3035 domain-containing protein [Pseudomonadota bacterium]